MNTDSEIQSIAFSVSCVVIRLIEAAVAAAPQIEWALKMEMSIPDFSKTVHNHLAIVDDVTGLCGFTVPINNVPPDLNAWGLCYYILNVCTGYRFKSRGKA